MNRHPLVSCQNPISKQRAVPCMTIRLTPQIISRLNQTPSPKISFCIKDRTINIDDARHPLQAFVEDPSLCEVYSLRSNRLVQVGNLEHKLIVQREVNTKNASSSTPRISDSSSAQSNPLAPKQISNSSQRAKRPRDSGTASSAAKRPATSNNSTPRRPVSRSPVDPKATSPERQSTQASTTKFKINPSLSLRDQVLHLLAIQPMSAAGIGRRLSQPTKNLATILKAIAQYEVPGKYRLHEDLLATVRIDAWPYSETEKNLVLKNIELAIPKNNEVRLQEGSFELASLSIDDDGLLESSTKSRKASSKRPSPQRSDIAPKESSPESSEMSHKRPSSQPSESNSKILPRVSESNSRRPGPNPNSSAREDTDLPPIETHEEYLSCRSRFEQMYPRYSAIDTRLKEIAAEFNSMALKLDSPQCLPAERRKIQQQVKELYAQLKPEVDRLKSEFSTMHEEISNLKSRIRIYVDSVLI